MSRQQNPIDLSIIIVNWNAVRFLRRCLTTIYNHVHGIEFEVIVIDNASYDGSFELVEKEFPQVRFIQSNENSGFARGNNLAFRESWGEFVLLLNPDTEMMDDSVATMIAHLRSDRSAGAVGCRVLNSDQSLQGQCVQAFPTIWNQVLLADALQRVFPRSRLWGRRPVFDYQDQPLDAEVVSGSCMMVRRTVFEEVGGFNEQYYMYGEDVDLCYKIRRAGHAVRYVGSKKLLHHGGASSAFRKENQFAAVMQMESLFRFFQITRGKAYAASYRYSMGGAAVVRLLLLYSLVPFARVLIDRKRLDVAADKWRCVLRWAAGKEPWAAAAGQ